jgi:hypothetical protein
MTTLPSLALSGLLLVILGGVGLGACTGEDASLEAGGDAADGSTSPDSSAGEAGAADSQPPPVGSPCSFDPSRFDVPGNGLDDDCNGKVDDEDPVCDGALTLASSDALDAAKAMGLCKKVGPSGTAWGVIDAKYVLPDGTATTGASATSWGLLPSFGTNTPRAGQRVLALSSGAARAADQPNYQAPGVGLAKGYGHALPAGFPRGMPACSGLNLANAFDGIALEVRLRVPTNARSFSFAHQFFTSDYGDSVCQAFNDVYAVLLSPKPAASPDGNVVLDALGGALTTNSTALVRACTPGTHNGLTFACPLSTASLVGTGFEGHASTGWLKTTVPVAGGEEITLRFAIWDSGDGSLDSTALFDDFGFSTASVPAVSTSAQ